MAIYDGIAGISLKMLSKIMENFRKQLLNICVTDQDYHLDIIFKKLQKKKKYIM